MAVATLRGDAGCRNVERDARWPALRFATAAEPVQRGFEPIEFHRVEPFPQHRLERIFPSALDVESLPEAMGLGEAVIQQPLRRILALTDLRLQRGQRLRARFDVRKLASGLLRGIAGRALAILQPLHGIAQRAQSRLLGRELGRFQSQLILDFRDLARAGRAERREIFLQALAATRKLCQQMGDVLAPGLDDANGLFGQRDLLLQIGGHRRGCSDELFQRRQRGDGGALVVARALPRRERVLDGPLDDAAVGEQPGLLAGERTELLGQLGDLLRDPGLALARERELLLQPRHLRVCLVEGALPLVHRIARGVVVRAQRLLPRFGGAHVGLQALERDRETGDGRRVALAGAGGVLLLREPKQLLHELQAGLVLAELGGDPCLRFELFQLRAELDPDILDAGQVLARVGQASFGFLAPLLVLRDAGGLLQEHAELLGLGLDHARDHALLDDRVGARPEARAEEEIVDVAAAHRDVVDVVRRVLVARQHALDRQLGILAPLAADPSRAVVERELDRRAADGLAFAGAVEDHVLHRFAAERGRLRLAEHPAHGVDHVGLAAAVGPDDPDQLAGRGDGRRINERLEPCELDLGEAQWNLRMWLAACTGKRPCQR